MKNLMKKASHKKLTPMLFAIILSLTLLATLTKSEDPAAQVVSIAESELFDSKSCPFDKLRAPLELNGKMKYDDFNVKLDFRTARNIETTKMDDSSYRLEGSGFGYIYYDDERYVVEKAYVKSPSDHKIEGSFLHGELQVQAVNGSNRLVLTKLLQEVPKVLDGYQGGLGQFGFGIGQLKFLKPKLSQEMENSYLKAGKAKDIPNMSYQPRKNASFNTFFIQDTKWMMYEGNETFDRC